MTWRVTESGTYKRIHTEGCRYGRHNYLYLDDCPTPEEVLLKLMFSDGLSVMWHLGCKACCPWLDDAIRSAQAAHMRRVALDHVEAVS